MRRRAGVLTLILTVAAGLALAPAASAEFVKTDIDGDGKKDLVGAGIQSSGNLMVAAQLSDRRGKTTTIEFPPAGATDPFIRAKGNVNRGRGNELFVRVGRAATADGIAILTVARGKLVNAGSFYLNGDLSDGFAAGIECGTVSGAPGVRAFLFTLGSAGRWTRRTSAYAWRSGRLVQRGSTKAKKVALPPSHQRTLGCPKSKAPVDPPDPPPVLGTSGNRYFTGLGGVEPRSFRARQGTGRYFGFTWRGWGGARASARGSFTTGPGAPRQGMSLSAFDLGRCGGRETYRKLTLKAAGGRAITLGVC